MLKVLNKIVSKDLKAVLRIHDILRIRIQIRGSMPLTNFVIDLQNTNKKLIF
jgi:hypothetical protein